VSRRIGEERGAAALLAVAMGGVLLLVAAALGVAAALVVDHRRAQSAADLAALAGAAAIGRGDQPCAAAGEVAGLNGADLRDCSTSGLTVTVRVRIEGPQWLGKGVGDLEAIARAGPADTGKGLTANK
jgi:secretion/DNA translocation related TadE-like protein